MAGRYALVVAVEDMATASIVAVDAAHAAHEHGATEVLLLHVLHQHRVLDAVIGMCGYCGPATETQEEGEAVLTLAEQALCAEFAAAGRPAPAIHCQIADGDATAVIERVVREWGADMLVLGARRPHAFGRLVHPDVRDFLTSRVPCHVRVAALQEQPAAVAMNP